MSYVGNPGSNKIITTDASGGLLPSTTGSGVSLSGGVLSLGGNLPTVGDYTWVPAGSGPWSNQGTAGAAVATAGTITSADSAGLWPSGRKGIRGYATNSQSDAVFNASNTFTAAWQSSSFTIEAYMQIDYNLGVIGGEAYPLVFNDFGLGLNAIYLKCGTASQTGFTFEVRRAAGSTTGSIITGIANNRPIHLAVVLDRTNVSAVTATAYVDGLAISTISLGAFAAFSNPFTQFQLLLGGAGVVGWASLTNSAKTAAQIRANTLLLKAA